MVFELASTRVVPLLKYTKVYKGKEQWTPWDCVVGSTDSLLIRWSGKSSPQEEGKGVVVTWGRKMGPHQYSASRHCFYPRGRNKWRASYSLEMKLKLLASINHLDDRRQLIRKGQEFERIRESNATRPRGKCGCWEGGGSHSFWNDADKISSPDVWYNLVINWFWVV